MKLIHHSFLAAFTVIAAPSLQAQEPIWVSHYGNNGNGGWNFGLKLVEDNGGGIYGVGTIGASGLDLDGHSVSVFGEQDVLLAKWDTSGHAVWARTAGGICPPMDWDEGQRIAYDQPGQRVIISGRYNCSDTHFGPFVVSSEPGDEANMFIASYDTAGTCLWAKGARGYRVGVGKVLVDHISNVFVIGAAVIGGAIFQEPSPVSIPSGGFIAKYGPNGALLDADRVLTNGVLVDATWTSGTEWVLAGYGSPGAMLYDDPLLITTGHDAGFVASADTVGNGNWITLFGSDSVAQVSQCVVNNSTVYASGYFIDNLILPNDTIDSDPGTMTFFITALDGSTGEVERIVPIRSIEQVLLYDLKMGPDGDLYAFGRFKENLVFTNATIASDHSNNGFVARFNSSGQCQAAWSFGPINLGRGSVLPSENGLYVSCDYDSTLVLGPTTITASHEGLSDLFLAKFGELTGFTGIQTRMAPNESLHIYANPNNGLCTIDLPRSLRATSDLVLSVYDQTGHLVQRVPLRFTIEGVRLDIRAQARGVYHIELNDGSQRYAGTIVFE